MIAGIGRSAFARFAGYGETDFAGECVACLDEARRRASEVWLGGRDSNPDNMLQRHASYRWTTSQYGRDRLAETLIIVGRKPRGQVRLKADATNVAGYFRTTSVESR